MNPYGKENMNCKSYGLILFQIWSILKIVGFLFPVPYGVSVFPFLWMKSNYASATWNLLFSWSEKTKTVFCNHGVITRRKGYDSIGFVRVLTLRIFMVRQMQSVNNFRDVSSHHVEWERQGQVHYDSFHGRYLSHIVV